MGEKEATYIRVSTRVDEEPNAAREADSEQYGTQPARTQAMDPLALSDLGPNINVIACDTRSLEYGAVA